MFFRLRSKDEKAPSRGKAQRTGAQPRSLGATLVGLFADARSVHPRDVLARAAEELLAATGAAAVGLYLSGGDTLHRAGLAATPAPGAEAEVALDQVETEPEAAFPGSASVAAIRSGRDAREWTELSGGEVWLLTSDAKRVERWLASGSNAEQQALARALASVGQSYLREREARAQRVDAEVQSNLMRAAMDAASTVELFLGVAVAGLSGQRGFVGVFDPKGQTFEPLAKYGDITPSLRGVELEELEGAWVALASDPGRVASGARSVYALARASRRGVVVFVVASGALAQGIGAATAQRVDRALDVIVSLQDAEAEVEHARKRGAQLLEALASMVDSDPRTSQHHVRVASAACWAAQALEVPENQRDFLMRAAALHDVGRVTGPEAGAAAALEFLHPSVGGQLLESFGEPSEVAHLVRNHHERFDGMGFPAGHVPERVDRASWALIAAECIVERAENETLSLPAAAAVWLAKAADGVLPPEALERLRREVERAPLIESSDIGSG